MPEVQRWMRLFTTMSLTMSNGLVLYAILPNHHHLWYDFWDANLGRPIGRTAQPYNKLRTCYIREYDNGWAVYSRSSITETITFDEVAVSVTTGNYDYIHEIPLMMGVSSSVATPTRVKPRDLLTTSWGTLKTSP